MQNSPPPQKNFSRPFFSQNPSPKPSSHRDQLHHHQLSPEPKEGVFCFLFFHNEPFQVVIGGTLRPTRLWAPEDRPHPLYSDP